MFAGAISLANSRSGDSTIGEQLIELGKSPEGLGGIPFDDSASWTDGQATLIQQRQWNTSESRLEKGIVQYAAGNLHLVSWARIDNRDELLKQLPDDLCALAETDAGLILGSYLHWGEKCCEYLVGDFVFAIVGSDRSAVFLGRDHMGVRPLYYYWHDGHFIFATSMEIINQISGIDYGLSEEWMVRYLMDCSQDWELCAYEKIKKVPPAHCLMFKDGQLAINRYFSFSPESDLNLSDDREYVDAYREALDEAVRCRVRSEYGVGSESSGGLDSSTITALASKWMETPDRNLHAFGFSNLELEPECIMAVSCLSPVRMTHLMTKTSFLEAGFESARKTFIDVAGYPVEHESAIRHWPFYEEAQKWGIRSLLSGFGGDEFGTNSGALALKELWLDKQYSLFISRQRGPLVLQILRALKWLYIWYFGDRTSGTARRVMKSTDRYWQNKIVEELLCDRYGIREKQNQAARYDSDYQSVNQFILGNRWSPMMTARMESCTLMAAKYGIEYRWPLLDVRLLKLFLSIPVAQKRGPGGISRYLHRRSVEGQIPDQIVWKTKSMGGPISKKSAVEHRSDHVPFRDIPDHQTLHPRLQEMVSPSGLEQFMERWKSNESIRKSNLTKIQIEKLNNINNWLGRTDCV